MRSLGITILALAILAVSVDSSARTLRILPKGGEGLPNIQEAVLQASPGDTVLVGPGTYRGAGNRDIMFEGKDIVLRSEQGPALTVIDCEGTVDVPHRAFKFCEGESRACVVEGFTIRGGYGPLDFSYYRSMGGAVLIYQSSPTIIGCVFEENRASYAGGIHCHYASPEIRDCSFKENQATWPAGAIYFSYSAPVVSDCVFRENQAGTSGGAVYCYQSTPTFTGCIFQENEAEISGGAIGTTRSTHSELISCTLSENVAGGDGSAISVVNASSSTITRTIISFGTGESTVYCGGIASVADLSCCDVFGNVGGDWVGCIADQFGVEGNIGEDPLFCDTPDIELFLQQSSPCLRGYGCGRIGVYGRGCVPKDPASPGGWDLAGSGAGRGQEVTVTWGAVRALFEP